MYCRTRDIGAPPQDEAKSASCGKWFVSIQTEREVEQPIPNGGAAGIDRGVARFATLSDGARSLPRSTASGGTRTGCVVPGSP